MRAEELLQPLAIDGTTLGTADGIEMQLQLLQAESAQEFDGKHDDFCVNCRTCLAQSLHAELVELAVASRLRTIIAEHRADVEELHESVRRIELVLQVRAHDRSRILGPQRKAALTSIGERIHLLFHDVGRLADAAQEKLRMLENRRADFMVPVSRT